MTCKSVASPLAGRPQLVLFSDAPKIDIYPVTRRWKVSGSRLTAHVKIGPVKLEVAFTLGEDGSWERNWSLTRRTSRLLGQGRGTGAFPSIDRALKQITVEFLKITKARRLEIDGWDARRNRHLATTYADRIPEEWCLKPVVTRRRMHPRADENGVVGIVISSRDRNFEPRSMPSIRQLLSLIGDDVILAPLAEVQELEITPDLFAGLG